MKTIIKRLDVRNARLYSISLECPTKNGASFNKKGLTNELGCANVTIEVKTLWK